MDSIKITDVETILISYPSPQALVSSSAKIEKIDCALVTVRTNAGVDGFGYIYILGGNPITPMKAVLDYLPKIVVGMDALQTMVGCSVACTAFSLRGVPLRISQ
jgi:L-alanine-DL-glutamate epimerase-like enolase superfamily enzyme